MEPLVYFQAPLSESTTDTAIARLAQRFLENGVVTETAPFVSEVRARETEQATWMGHSLALPHARTARASKLALSIGTHPTGIPWGPDKQLARLVVLVAVPPSAIAPYLILVRSISKLARHPKSIAAVLGAANATELETAWRAGMKL